MMLYHVISYDVISSDIVYNMIWYYMTWHHISRGRGCRRGHGIAMQWRQETCFRNFALGKWPSNIQKIQKNVRKFCACLLSNHYKMIWFRSSYDNLSFWEKWYFCANWICLRVTVKKTYQSIHFSNHNQNQFWGRRAICLTVIKH